ncbi:MAG: hypothetical protein R3A47_02135 [Polyangiales bacterium]
MLSFTAAVFFDRVELPAAASPIVELFRSLFGYLPRSSGAVAIMAEGVGHRAFVGENR